MKHLRQKC